MRMFATGMFLLGVVAAVPASAQIAGPMRGLSGSASLRGDILRDRPADPRAAQRVAIGREVRDIRDQIRDGREAGQLSRSQARALRREGRRIEAASDRFGRDGYSEAELMMLRSRTEALRGAMVARRSQGLPGK